MSGRSLSRGLRRVGSWLAAAVALLLVINVGDRVMSFDNAAVDRERPFEVSVKIGSTAVARTFTASVESVRGAGAIIDPTGGNPHASVGVWIIVTIRAAGRDEPAAIGFTGLRDAAGRVYWASERVKQGISGGRTLQPGVRIEGEVAFEVPKSAATSGLTVLLGPNMFERRMENLLAFPLDPIDAATVERWAADKKATLTATKVLG